MMSTKARRIPVAVNTREALEFELERTLDHIFYLGAEVNTRQEKIELRNLGMHAAGLLGTMRGRTRRWRTLRLPENLQRKLDDTWGRSWRDW